MLKRGFSFPVGCVTLKAHGANSRTYLSKNVGDVPNYLSVGHQLVDVEFYELNWPILYVLVVL